MKKYTLFATLLTLSLIGCEELTEDKIEIHTGTICGWCGHTDSLVVTRETSDYKVKDPCTLAEYKHTEVTNDEEWEKLMELFDWGEFKKVKINTCNVCVDGCDTHISITKGLTTHSIRFGGSDDPEMKEIKDFTDQLNAVKTRFHEGADLQDN